MCERQKVERFSSLYGRKCAKSSRCWRESLLIRCTADTGTVLRESMCGSVWIRARTTWKEKWRLTSSRATYVQPFLLVDKPISPILALSICLIYLLLVYALKWIQLSVQAGNKPDASAGKHLTSGKRGKTLNQWQGRKRCNQSPNGGKTSNLGQARENTLPMAKAENL